MRTHRASCADMFQEDSRFEHIHDALATYQHFMQSRLAPKENGKANGRGVVGAGNRSAGIDGSHQRQPNGDWCHLSRGGHGQLDGKDKDERAHHFHDRIAEFAPKVLHSDKVIIQENEEPYQVSRKNYFIFPVVSGFDYANPSVLQGLTGSRDRIDKVYVEGKFY